MITFQAGTGYGEPIRGELIELLGEDGAWLVLSIDHYGWRARYDLAIAVTTGAQAESDHHRRHLQSVVDLEVQSGLYAAVEILARLIKAVASHQDRTTAFFDAYVSNYTLPGIIEEMRGIDRAVLDRMFELPADPRPLAASLWRHGSPVDAETAEHLLVRIHAIIDDLAMNLDEVSRMVERLDLTGTGAPVAEGHSLRTADNAYRHGLKILLHDAVPQDRTFGLAVRGEANPLGEYAIDLFQSTTEPKFATIDASPERTQEHLAAIEVVCVRIKQVVRCFIAKMTRQPALLATVVDVDINEIDISLQDG
ncbi:MAG TPA: hypothetical protein VJ935_03585 [Acidimicrobiia bacterium]|nr:hypothetical protein [Acidimicrobiia bacterium]